MYINQSGNYTLTQEHTKGRYVYLQDSEMPTMLYILEDTDQTKLQVYCLDKSKLPLIKMKYSVMNLSELKNVDENSVNYIRNILINSFPYISLKEVQTRSSITALTEEDAIAGAQIALWYYSNKYHTTWKTSEHPEQRYAEQLYYWYLRLPQIAQNDTVAHLEINATQENNNINFAYKASHKNYNQTEIIPTYKINPEISSKKLPKDDLGYYHALTQKPVEDSVFSVMAEQIAKEDAYMFMTLEGPTKSQTFGAVDSGIFKLKQDYTVSYGTLKIINTDESNKAIGGGLFNIYPGADTSKTPALVNLISDSGTINVSQLLSGPYCINQTSPPKGYYPNKDIKTSYVRKDLSPQVTFINEKKEEIPYGSLEIKAISNRKDLIEGAVYDVYAGSDTSGTPIYKDLITGNNGTVLIENLVPSDYTIIQKSIPKEYISISKVKYIKITQDEKTTSIFINMFLSSYYKRKLSVTNIIQSVALEQAAISHILNAEGEKIQKVVKQTNTNCQLLKKTNKSVEQMTNSISSLEMIIQSKLQLFDDCLCIKR